MKQKITKIMIGIVAIFIIAIARYNIPVDFMNVEPTDVKEIVVFNGNTGTETHITNKEDIAHIIDNWNAIRLKRDGISMGDMGYSFKVTIEMDNGKKGKGFQDFIINSNTVVRKDPFYYTTQNEMIDYDYISNIAD